MQASEVRLSRFLGQGRPVVVAIDHGLFDGPIEGMENLEELAGKIWSGLDAVLLSPGSMRLVGRRLFGSRGGPMAIVRINWSTIYCFTWGYASGETVGTFEPEDAIHLGAEAVLVSLSLQTGSEARDAANVSLFSRLCRRAHDYGLVVIGEYFPVAFGKLTREQLAEEIKIGCRILAELGADAIKTFHTADFREAMRGCTIPVLTLGGEKYPTPGDALTAAARQVADGAAGVVFGRNAIQVAKPIEFQKALVDVVKHGLPAGEAMAKYESM